MKAKVVKTGEIVDVYHEPQHGQITNIYKESVLVNGRMWTEDELNFCVKTSEAPEKIYISPAGVLYKGDKQQNSDIEYVRKDAFIEAVADWMYDNLQTVVDVNHPSAHHVESLPVLGIITQTEFVEKFKKEIEYLLD